MPYLHIRPAGSDGELLSNEETDAMVAEGMAAGKFRQCSIGYHDECSDPMGNRCQCDCHRDARRSE